MPHIYLAMAQSRKSISRFLLEIFSIFLGVTIAFFADHWNEQRKERVIEEKTLKEITVELKEDLIDLRLNMTGHTRGIKAIDMFVKYSHNEPVDYDSLGLFYPRLYSEYLSITNTTAYETLRSRGIQIISNDELRGDIVNLYDFAYEIIEKLEEGYEPTQFHRNYFDDISDYFKVYMKVENDQVRFIKAHQGTPDAKTLLIFKEIKFWRNFILSSYADTEKKILQLIEDIDTELEQ